MGLHLHGVHVGPTERGPNYILRRRLLHCALRCRRQQLRRRAIYIQSHPCLSSSWRLLQAQDKQGRLFTIGIQHAQQHMTAATSHANRLYRACATQPYPWGSIMRQMIAPAPARRTRLRHTPACPLAATGTKALAPVYLSAADKPQHSTLTPPALLFAKTQEAIAEEACLQATQSLPPLSVTAT